MDNRSHQEATWDTEMLPLEFAELEAMSADLLLTGFDATEIAGFLQSAENSNGSPASPGNASLSERFGVPPFSVLDARQGYWQERKRKWLDLGIESELGRGGGTWRNPEDRRPD